MTFRIGMKVCCIHEGEWQARYSLFTRTYHRWLCRFPELGKVYTVAAVDLLDTGAPGIALVECRPDRFIFHRQFFRPLVETKTDISIFHRILDRVKRGEPVDA